MYVIHLRPSKIQISIRINLFISRDYFTWNLYSFNNNKMTWKIHSSNDANFFPHLPLIASHKLVTVGGKENKKSFDTDHVVSSNYATLHLISSVEM